MSFSPKEIFEIAVQIERNGINFYRRAAEIATDDECKQMLTSLVEMEEDHRQTFQQAQDRLIDPAAAEMVFGDDEMMQYIRAMADGHVFDVGVDPASILTGTEDEEEILSIAIGLEKESVVYYSALKETVVDDRTRTRLEEIIREEMSHIAELSGRREALK